jgi:hypothetical protein
MVFSRATVGRSLCAIVSRQGGALGTNSAKPGARKPDLAGAHTDDHGLLPTGRRPVSSMGFF